MHLASKSSGLATHAENVMYSAAQELSETLERHYHTGDIAQAREMAEELSRALRLMFNASVGQDRQLILELQTALTLKPRVASSWLAEQPATLHVMDQNSVDQFLMQHPDILPNMSVGECAEVIRKAYGLANREEAKETAFRDFGVDLGNLFGGNNAEQENPVVRNAIKHFAQDILTFDEEKHETLLSLGAKPEVLRGLLEQLKQGLETRKISERVSQYLVGNPTLTINGQIDSLKMGALLSHHWNEFVFHLSSSYYAQDELENLEFKRENREIDSEAVFQKLGSMFKEEALANLPEVHFAPALSTVTLWHQRLSKLFLVNCGFANYDLEANQELGALLGQLESMTRQ